MTYVLTSLFAVLALVAMGTAVGLVASARLRAVAAPHALGAAAAVSGTATAGSLYLSEVAGYVPCELCWWQRIFMYSIATITTVALLRRRPDVLAHVPALAVLGLVTSLWHVAVQRIPAAGDTCDPLNPCSAIYVERFGFITIPVMAGMGFAAVLALAWTASRAGGTSPPASPDPATPEPLQEQTR